MLVVWDHGTFWRFGENLLYFYKCGCWKWRSMGSIKGLEDEKREARMRNNLEGKVVGHKDRFNFFRHFCPRKIQTRKSERNLFLLHFIPFPFAPPCCSVLLFSSDSEIRLGWLLFLLELFSLLITSLLSPDSANWDQIQEARWGL